MELTLLQATVTLAVLVLVGGEKQTQKPYIAFPRMGRSEIQKKPQLPLNFIVPRKRAMPKGFIIPRKRAEDDNGYLAFPRMGRSQLKPETFFDNGACCGVGVKAEYFVSQDGKEVIRSSCAPHLVCCEGLREINDEKTDGVYFSLCIPDTPLAEESGVRSSEILSSLKRLLEK